MTAGLTAVGNELWSLRTVQLNHGLKVLKWRPDDDINILLGSQVFFPHFLIEFPCWSKWCRIWLHEASLNQEVTYGSIWAVTGGGRLYLAAVMIIYKGRYRTITSLYCILLAHESNIALHARTGRLWDQSHTAALLSFPLENKAHLKPWSLAVQIINLIHFKYLFSLITDSDTHFKSLSVFTEGTRMKNRLNYYIDN